MVVRERETVSEIERERESAQEEEENKDVKKSERIYFLIG